MLLYSIFHFYLLSFHFRILHLFYFILPFLPVLDFCHHYHRHHPLHNNIFIIVTILIINSISYIDSSMSNDVRIIIVISHQNCHHLHQPLWRVKTPLSWWYKMAFLHHDFIIIVNITVVTKASFNIVSGSVY